MLWFIKALLHLYRVASLTFVTVSILRSEVVLLALIQLYLAQSDPGNRLRFDLRKDKLPGAHCSYFWRALIDEPQMPRRLLMIHPGIEPSTAFWGDRVLFP